MSGLYTERHTNLKAYRVGRGQIIRNERDPGHGRIIQKIYRAGDIIMLTEEGAKHLHGNMLQEASRSAVTEVIVEKAVKAMKEEDDTGEPDEGEADETKKGKKTRGRK